jgi:hypothetical protein
MTDEEITPVSTQKSTKQRKPRRSKKKAKKRAIKPSNSPLEERRGRGATKSFPTASFEESISIAEIIQRETGNKMRRIRIFEMLGKSPDSGPSRQLVTNSSKYGLTTGGYQADHIELTPLGQTSVNPDADAKERVMARFTLAIHNIVPFDFLYNRLGGNKLPSQGVMQDILREAEVSEEDIAACVDIFVVNAKFVGLLQTVAGAERVLKIDQVVEELPVDAAITTPTRSVTKPSGTPVDQNGSGIAWNEICFYITPIGDEGTELRKHSDLFLNHIVEPALEGFNLKVVRADKIGNPGMIGSQILEHILRARLVIADLSFHNPNVFYELSLRHTCGLPSIQIIRSADKLPFDLQQYRTVPIDTTDIFSLVPKLGVYKSQIATQVRSALENSESIDNPITTYFPELTVSIPPIKAAAKAGKVKVQTAD